MLDYHLHLWPHTDRDTPIVLDQVARYCERAAAAGVTEVALTEHLFRFRQADDLLRGFWDSDEPSPALRASMAEYWEHHARADLDAYVECVGAAKQAGLPVVLGLEVDHYRGRMDRVAELLAGYPFDVLLGSVHWLGAWRFDDGSDAPSVAEWSARGIDEVWDAYTEAMEELATSRSCDVLAHPDLVKVMGHVPACPEEWWDRLVEAAVSSKMAAEVSSAGWRKPVGEQYPAAGLLERFAAAGVPCTTASDAHHLEHVADHGDLLRRCLADAGITQLQAYHERRPHPVAIAPLGAGGPGGAGPAIGAGAGGEAPPAGAGG